MDKKVQVTVKNIAQSPQKMRLVANLIRGKQGDQAESILKFTTKKASAIVIKALRSGLANAMSLYNLDKGQVKVTMISVDEARNGRGQRFASRGRFSKITKRRSHLNLELSAK